MKAKFLFSLTLLSFLFVSSVNAEILTHDPSGTYDFEVTDIPDQPDVKGTMVVSKENGAVKVKFSSSAGEIDLQDAKLDGHKLTGKFEVQGIMIKVKGTFTSNGFEGQLDTEFGAMGITGTKK